MMLDDGPRHSAICPRIGICNAELRRRRPKPCLSTDRILMKNSIKVTSGRTDSPWWCDPVIARAVTFHSAKAQLNCRRRGFVVRSWADSRENDTGVNESRFSNPRTTSLMESRDNEGVINSSSSRLCQATSSPVDEQMRSRFLTSRGIFRVLCGVSGGGRN